MRYCLSFLNTENWFWLLFIFGILFQFVNKYVLYLIAFLCVKFATFILFIIFCFLLCLPLRAAFFFFFFPSFLFSTILLVSGSAMWSANVQKYHNNKICYYLILLSTHTHISISFHVLYICVYVKRATCNHIYVIYLRGCYFIVF